MINEANLQSRKAKLGVPLHLVVAIRLLSEITSSKDTSPPKTLSASSRRRVSILPCGAGMPVGSPGMEDGDNKNHLTCWLSELTALQKSLPATEEKVSKPWSDEISSPPSTGLPTVVSMRPRI